MADIEGRMSYIRHIHQDDIVHIIYSVTYRNVKHAKYTIVAMFRAPPTRIIVNPSGKCSDFSDKREIVK